MSLILRLHPQTPPPRLVQQAVDHLRRGALIAYPTDSSYAFGWCLNNKAAQERVEQLRRTDKNHHFTLICRDLSEIATYARVDTWQFRLLKAATPGPFTFILRATHEVPRRLQHPKRKTVGLRVPDHPVPLALLAALGEPLLSSTLSLPDEPLPLNDPEEIDDRVGHAIDVILDGGMTDHEPTTVLDLSGESPLLIRQGKGDVSPYFPR